jgi:hypothetical protein
MNYAPNYGLTPFPAVFMSSGAAAFGCPAHLNLSTPPYLPTLRRLEAGAL